MRWVDKLWYWVGRLQGKREVVVRWVSREGVRVAGSPPISRWGYYWYASTTWGGPYDTVEQAMVSARICGNTVRKVVSSSPAGRREAAPGHMNRRAMVATGLGITEDQAQGLIAVGGDRLVSMVSEIKDPIPVDAVPTLWDILDEE